jgi:alpha-glucosidase
LGNHDQPRIAARVGEAQARIAAMLLLTLRGTPTMYYGDELGIGPVAIPHDAMKDPWGKNEPGLGLGRDPSRTPFQWDATANAGFTSGTPWLPVDASYKSQNVAVLRTDAASILNLYRNLLSMCRKHPALVRGTFRLLSVEGNALVYERKADNQCIVVCLNFGDTEQPLPVEDLGRAIILASTHPDRAGLEPKAVLRPNEGLAILTA